MIYLQKVILIMFLAVIVSSTWTAAEDLIHVVGRGETIYSISRFYDVTADDLMKANGISDPSKLQAGKRLTIPSNVMTVPTSVPASSAVQNLPAADYKVVRGDTLFSIARTHGVSLANLLEMNRFSETHVIKVGDTIKVPSRTHTQTAGTSAGSSSASIPAASVPAASVTASQPTSNAALLALRWPVTPKEISYMTGQMGVIVEGDVMESVRSLTQGRVISAGPWRKFGKVAIVEAAGGYLYMYGGHETLSVKVGDRIAAGTELGKLGINAVSERPQLFFMVFRSDTPIDPAKAPRAGGNARS